MSLKKLLRLFLLSIVVYFIYTACKIYQFSFVDEAQKSDVIIVLGTAVWHDEPSPVFKERILHGINLYHKGYAPKIIFTGGKSEGNKYSESYTAQLFAENHGVPETDILIEEKSTITDENFLFAKEIMVNHGFKTALIVSDPMHMRRSLLYAKDYDIPAYSSPTPTTRYQSFNSKFEFLMRETTFYLLYQIYRIFR